MKAAVWHGLGDVRLDEVPDPGVSDPTDAIVEITTSAICGTDPALRARHDERHGRGHGPGPRGPRDRARGRVRRANLRPGDRVVIPSTIGCGTCSYCRAGYYAQCDKANPNGPSAGTCFFGGADDRARRRAAGAVRPRAVRHVGPIWLPEEVTYEQAIMLSDIYPTAWFGCRLAEVGQGDTVLMLGAGPVGRFAITSAFQQGSGRVLCVDGVPSRLEQARARGAEVVDFNREDPVAVVQELTAGIGASKAWSRPSASTCSGRRADRPPSRPSSSQPPSRRSARRSRPSSDPRTARGCRATRPASRCSEPARRWARPGPSASSGSTRRR
jgi:threonine dehydrogenase-like Zn-dependent dehydrogenase